MGQDELASRYSEFYLAGWQYFLSGYDNTDAGRAAILAAVEVLTLGEAVAVAWLADHPVAPEIQERV